MRDWHIHNDEMTRDAIRSSNIVVNLIGASLETRNFSFEDVHSAWPAKLAKMVADNGKAGVCWLAVERGGGSRGVVGC